MNPIQLLFAENIVSRQHAEIHQRLTFCVAVRHVAFEKSVDVHWAGEDGRWQVLPAHYVRTGGDHEVWQADASFPLGADAGPGIVQFAIRYRSGDLEAWDNNHDQNHRIECDAGVVLGPDVPVANLHPSPQWHRHRHHYSIAVAVDPALSTREVQIHWTTDRWRSMHVAACHLRPRHGQGGRARTAAIWSGHLPVQEASRVEYALAAVTESGRIWDNNFGANYVAFGDRLKVLTLNLHCFQEHDADRKLSQIARAINDDRIDIICLQEVGEPLNDGSGDFSGNAARIIRSRLRHHYNLVQDWSHIGFDRFREGSAILSRFDLTMKDSGYVSESQDRHNIHARKVVMAQVQVPNVGLVNVFSTHLSWWSDGFKTQFENLRRWADERHTPAVTATLLCGDFNSEPASEGYALATQAGEYEDQFARVRARHDGDMPADDRRIDYIFLKKGSPLQAVAASVRFTTDEYGPVSDHPGYYAEFEYAG